MTVKLNNKQKEVIKKLINFNNWNIKHDEILLDGGSRAGKSYFICYIIVLLCFVFPLRILFCRSKLIDLKATLLTQTFEPLLQKHFAGRWTKKTVDNSIVVYNIGLSEIWASGLDNTNRSDKILGSEYNIIYYNECLDISPMIRSKVKTRLSLKTEGFKNFTISDCNPGNPQHYIYKRFYRHIDEKGNPLDNRLTLFRETFLPEDNIENISEDYINQVLDTMTGATKERFRHGRWANVDGQVNKNILDDHIIECNKDLLYYDDVIIGMDFGYYTAYNIWGIKDRKAYCFYDYKLIDGTTADIIGDLRKHRYLNKYFIYADHELDRINEIESAGFLIKPAYKEVGAGDSTVNSFELFFDHSCMNTFNSMQNLRRPQDRDGNYIDGKHIKEDDHEADCFSGNTKILMANGKQKKIKHIKAGEYVMTRFGERKVLRSWMTGRKLTKKYKINGIEIRSTPNHKLFIYENGCIIQREIQYINIADTLILWSEYRNKPIFDFCKEKIYYDEKIIKTYNLTIEHIHEYFANGILVSNCGRYALHGYAKDNGFHEQNKTFKKLNAIPRMR